MLIISKIVGGSVIGYLLVFHTTHTIVGIIIGGVGYKLYKDYQSKQLNGMSINNPLKIPKKGFTKDPTIKPPYPKLHKPDATTIHFPKNKHDGL